MIILAARLMHKYNAHGATDITGFGLLGHANNLARIQKNEIGFVIHNLPIIAKMAAVSKACGNMFGLLQGHSAETSGKMHGCFVVCCTSLMKYVVKPVFSSHLRAPQNGVA